jgi:integrase
VVSVKLKGLKIARARGKYYVYRRDTGALLLKGFEGDIDALRKRLAEPDMIGLYNVGRKRTAATAYAEKSLGWLVAWYTDPEKCEEFKDLAEATRDKYKKALAFLEPVYDTPLADITQANIYLARDNCSKEKWPALADKMVTALATMFKLAVQRGWMAGNPAQGIERKNKSDPNANREWRPEEWEAVISRAPLKLRIPMMLARYVGYRVQSIARVQWSNYQDDRVYGKCFRMDHRKNDEEQHWLPAVPELQAFLDGLTRTSTYIAVKHDGTPWRDQEQMRKQISNFISELEQKGVVGAGLTPHGLRVTFAAARKRERRVTDEEVAAALGDRDKRMGAHYTRHVENEIKVIRAFGKPKKPRRKKNENGT